jgi:hypothetical protein
VIDPGDAFLHHGNPPKKVRPTRYFPVTDTAQASAARLELLDFFADARGGEASAKAST